MLRRLRSRVQRLPRDVRRSLPLAGGERVLTSGGDRAGCPVVATTERLLLRDGEDGWESLPWHQILRAQWESGDDRFVLEVLDESTGQALVRPVDLAEPAKLPETVRERVTATIVVSQHVRLAGRQGVRLVARRVPRQLDLEWQLVFDQGLDPADPHVQEQATAALQDVRRQTTM